MIKNKESVALAIQLVWMNRQNDYVLEITYLLKVLEYWSFGVNEIGWWIMLETELLAL